MRGGGREEGFSPCSLAKSRNLHWKMSNTSPNNILYEIIIIIQEQILVPLLCCGHSFGLLTFTEVKVWEILVSAPPPAPPPPIWDGHHYPWILSKVLHVECLSLILLYLVYRVGLHMLYIFQSFFPWKKNRIVS